ncbi:hypothetical protein RJT34_12089 [Clitoria ternatea]|uniref:DUF8018 domain-containing protein n=1 Tax=Clitoria ternatea TaxID=43366 RepID=A0AAN9JNT1_CLITE
MPVPPANPVASGEAEAGLFPFPNHEDEVIGGDSILSIQRGLLGKYDSPTTHEIKMALYEAEDLFGVKVDIIRLMTSLDPEEDWLNRGARALDNPYAPLGETS